MQPLSHPYISQAKEPREVQRPASLPSTRSVSEEELIENLRGDLITIGMIDSKGNLLFAPKVTTQLLEREGQIKMQRLLESEVPFHNKEGKKLFSMTEWEFILGFGKKCYSNKIPITTFLRGGYGAYVWGIARHFELLVHQFLELHPELPLTARIKDIISQLKEMKRVALPPHDIDWLKITLNGEVNLWMVRSLLIEFVAEKFVCVMALEYLHQFIEEKNIQNQQVSAHMKAIIGKVKYFDDLKRAAKEMESLDISVQNLLTEFIKTRLEPSQFYGFLESQGFINLLIPSTSPLFPLPAHYLVTSVGNPLDAKTPKTDLAIGSLERLFLFPRDDLRLNISNGFSRCDTVDKVNVGLVTVESTDLFQMLVHRKLKFVALDSWHLHDFRAALTAIQLMLQGHILIEDKCSLQSIWAYALKQSDPYVVYAIIERAKWHMKDSFSYLMTCYLHMRARGIVPKELADPLKKAIRESINQITPAQKWGSLLIAFLDCPEAFLFAFHGDTENAVKVEWDTHGEGILTLFLGTCPIIFPKTDFSSFFKKNQPKQVFYSMIESKEASEGIEKVLFMLNQQKKNTPLSQDLLDALIGYLMGPENIDERKGLAGLLDPWLKIKTIDNLSWVKALLSYVYQKGILLWSQTKGTLPEDVRLKQTEEIFTHLCKERPNTAFMQLGEENIPKLLRKKILYFLINNLNTSLNVIQQIAEEFFPVDFEPYTDYEADLILILNRLKTKEALSLLQSFSPFSKTLAPAATSLLLKAAMESCEIATVLSLMQQIAVRGCSEGSKIFGWLNASQIGFLRNQKDFAILVGYFSVLRFYKVVEGKDEQVDSNLSNLLQKATMETSSHAILLFKACKHRFIPSSGYLDLAKHLFLLSQDSDVGGFLVAAIKGHPQTKRTETGIATLQFLSEIPEKAFSSLYESVSEIDGLDQTQMLHAFKDENTEILASEDSIVLMSLLEDSRITKPSIQKKIIRILLERSNELSERQLVLLFENLKKYPDFSSAELYLNRTKISLKKLVIPFLQELNKIGDLFCDTQEYREMWDGIIDKQIEDAFQLISLFDNPATGEDARKKILKILLPALENLTDKERALLLESLLKEPDLFFDAIKTGAPKFIAFTISFLHSLHERGHLICQTALYKEHWEHIFDRQDAISLIPCFKDFSLIRFLYGELGAYVKLKNWIMDARSLQLQETDKLTIDRIESTMKDIYFLIESLKSSLKETLNDGKAVAKQQLALQSEQAIESLIAKLLSCDPESKIKNYTFILRMINTAHTLKLLDPDQHFSKLERLFSYNLKFPFIDTIPFGFDLLYDHLSNLDFIDFNPHEWPSSDQELVECNEKRNNVLKNWLGVLDEEGQVYQKHAEFLRKKGNFKIFSIAHLQLVDSISFSLKNSLMQFRQSKDPTAFRKEIRKKSLDFADLLLINKVSITEPHLDPCLRLIDQVSRYVENHGDFLQLFVFMLEEWESALSKKFSPSSILKKKLDDLAAIRKNLQAADKVNRHIVAKKIELDKGLILYTEFIQLIVHQLQFYSPSDNFLKRGPFADLHLKGLHPVEFTEIRECWALQLQKSENPFHNHRAHLLRLPFLDQNLTIDQGLEYIFRRQKVFIQKLTLGEVTQSLYDDEQHWFVEIGKMLMPTNELEISYIEKWTANMKSVFPAFPVIHIQQKNPIGNFRLDKKRKKRIVIKL